MFSSVYRHLKNNNIEVYSIGQHEGLCESPYVVLKENGVGEIVGTSLVNDVVELMIYYPLGNYSELESYKTLVKNAMKSYKGIRRILEQVPTIVDGDKKAYMTSFRYRKIKKKEGA